MSDAYVVEVGGQTAGIVVRDSKAETSAFSPRRGVSTPSRGFNLPSPMRRSAQRANWSPASAYYRGRRAPQLLTDSRSFFNAG
jgi:hypothetical protein